MPLWNYLPTPLTSSALRNAQWFTREDFLGKIGLDWHEVLVRCEEKLLLLWYRSKVNYMSRARTTMYGVFISVNHNLGIRRPASGLSSVTSNACLWKPLTTINSTKTKKSKGREEKVRGKRPEGREKCEQAGLWVGECGNAERQEAEGPPSFLTWRLLICLGGGGGGRAGKGWQEKRLSWLVSEVNFFLSFFLSTIYTPTALRPVRGGLP